MATLAKRTGEASRKTQVTVNGGSGERVERHLSGSDTCQSPLPDGAKPSPTPATNVEGSAVGLLVETVPAAVPALEWGRPEGDMLRSTCGRYSIHRIEVGPFKTYELWKMVPSGNWFSVLRQGLGSSAEAKALAEAHLKANP